MWKREREKSSWGDKNKTKNTRTIKWVRNSCIQVLFTTSPNAQNTQNKLKMKHSGQFIQNLSICFHQYIKLKAEMRATTPTDSKQSPIRHVQYCKTQLIVSSSNCVYIIWLNFRRHQILSFTMCHATLPPQVQTEFLSIYVIKLFIFLREKKNDEKLFHFISFWLATTKHHGNVVCFTSSTRRSTFFF